MFKPSSPEALEVVAIKDISPHMRRITLAGHNLSGSQDDCVGGYIKILFNNDGQSKPAMRTYTIRSFDRAVASIDVDFVLHGDGGLASSWANSVNLGDKIEIAGPGSRKLPNENADWFFLVSDMSSLPALSINLEMLEEHARGYALIFVDDIRDRQELIAPQGIQVEWVLLGQDTESKTEKQMELVKGKLWLDGTPAVWLAGEFETVKKLRGFFQKEMNVPQKQSYYSSYWKHGLTEPDHKTLKQSAKEGG